VTRTPIIVSAIQTGARSNGGIESITQIVCRLRNHRPIILTNRVSGQSEKWQQLGIEVHVVPEVASAGLRRNLRGSLPSYWRYYAAINRLLAVTGARIVHANDPLAFQLSFAAAKLRGAKIALNLRDTIDPSRKPPRWRYRWLFHAADHVFYLSQDMADRWASIAPNAKRACSVTYSIVDPNQFPSAPLRVREGKPIVLLAGIFRPKKGQLDFLRHAAPSIVAGGADIWLAGDFDPVGDPYSAACAAAAEPMRDAVKFLGYRSDFPELLRQATVVAIPSRHEGLMRTMIEAMSLGRPVVSFDVCSAREMLEERSGGAGTVVQMGDFAGMASAALAYCTFPQDAAKAGAAGAAAAACLFEPERVVQKYENVYRLLTR
jgi:glycosyltransferase involved in cell wall biosynthesis